MRKVWWLPGASLIFFGILVFIFPELLAFIVAAAFISLGVILLTVQRMMRRPFSRSVTGYRIYRQQNDSSDQIYVD